MVMGPGRTTAPIPIHQTKEATGYMDMMASGLTSQTQTLPTVKESGSKYRNYSHPNPKISLLNCLEAKADYITDFGN